MMPSMAYLLLPFKMSCVLTLLRVRFFFFVLPIERDMARANMNTNSYTRERERDIRTRRGEKDNEICVDNLFNNFVLIDGFPSVTKY